jgi:hypothetical protein
MLKVTDTAESMTDSFVLFGDNFPNNLYSIDPDDPDDIGSHVICGRNIIDCECIEYGPTY